ncbi:putative fluoride ion transporter CrcB [Oxalicibacterium flavum]|uniref:Fluoride-specific ion channel FluC n=1 Tax=Oxalicibacterium flavum TaxID=179467 RepID=A0A8J2Y009_9BURK|nr:fluoride efflux transporter CrcB [Oxalicibacterium flavum]GGC17865.1 putative fluoride ion transporter CrcB [Oxalicibacterium flavum]
MSWLAVGVGGVLGCWLRWGLQTGLNAFAPHVPLGTLLANLGGGYLIGVAVAFFIGHPDISPEWRLLTITGFLGGLTTFSSFSAESFLLLQRGDYLWALAHTALHLFGSLLFCAGGFATYRALSA